MPAEKSPVPGWKHMFGSYYRASSWDGLDKLWRIVEEEIQSHFIIAASKRYNSHDSALLQEGLRNMSSLARGKWQSFPGLMIGETNRTSRWFEKQTNKMRIPNFSKSTKIQ